MAIAEANRPGISGASEEATKQALAFVQSWRSLFELMMSNRDFRALIVDAGEIARRVFLRHTEGLGEKAKQEFLAGVPATDIAKDVKGDAQQRSQSPATGEYEVKMSNEESDQLQRDVARVLSILGKNPNFRDGVNRIFELFDIARDQVRGQVKTGLGKGDVELANPHARKAQQETEKLIAAFSGKKTLDDFMENLKKIIRKVDNDNETRQYLNELRAFIVEESAKQNDEEALKRRINELIDRGRELSDKYRYADEVNAFLDSSDQLMENIKNDEMVSLLRHHAGIVASDLSYTDPSGETRLDTEVLDKLRSALIPILADAFKYIPVPKIEHVDHNKHYWVDNIVLCGFDVIPDRVKVHMESDSDLSIRDIEVKKSRTRLVVTLKEIRTELKNMDFYYNKKTFPQMTERGKFTLRLGGDGATLQLLFNIEQNATDRAPRLTDGRADFTIHKMDITFDKSTLTHDVLFPMFTTMFQPSIKNKIENEVENSLQKLIDNIAGRLSEALGEVNRPLLSRLENVKATLKCNEFGQAFEARKEKLE
jgi:hypothetical protein